MVKSCQAAPQKVFSSLVCSCSSRLYWDFVVPVPRVTFPAELEWMVMLTVQNIVGDLLQPFHNLSLSVCKCGYFGAGTDVK